jgi:hypothetical protein
MRADNQSIHNPSSSNNGMLSLCRLCDIQPRHGRCWDYNSIGLILWYMTERNTCLCVWSSILANSSRIAVNNVLACPKPEAGKDKGNWGLQWHKFRPFLTVRGIWGFRTHPMCYVLVEDAGTRHPPAVTVHTGQLDLNNLLPMPEDPGEK